MGEFALRFYSMDRRYTKMQFLLLLVLILHRAETSDIHPKISEVYLKPSATDIDNEEYLEIQLPATTLPPTYIQQYGLLLIDRSFILDYLDFRRLKNRQGRYDQTDNKQYIVISNNETTPNLLHYVPWLLLRADNVKALLLIKQPSAEDATKLELRFSKESYKLRKSAPLTFVNKEVLRKLTIDIVVHRRTYMDGEDTEWILSVLPNWTGELKTLPTGPDDLMDRVSLARCDNLQFSGNTFLYDIPSPGTKNLCVKIDEQSPVVDVPSGMRLLMDRRLQTTNDKDQEEAAEYCNNYATTGTSIEDVLPELKANHMLVKNMERFFKENPNRFCYVFLRDPSNLRKSSIRCELCHQALSDPSATTSLARFGGTPPDIVKQTGQKFREQPKNTWQQISRHEDLDFHKNNLKNLKKVHGPTKNLDVYEEIPASDDLEVTADKIALVYLEVKVGLSMRSHEVLSEGLYDLGFPVGSSLNGRWAAHQIIGFLGQQIHRNLIARLMATDTEFSIMLDSSTDIGLVHTILIYIRFIEDNTPVNKVFHLAEAHDSTANGMWNVIESLIRAEGPNFVLYFKRKCVAIATDGASNMMGQYNSLKTKFTSYVMVGNRQGKKFQHYHCANHKLALAYNDVVYSSDASLAFCKKMIDHVNNLARFYSSKSYKRRDEMLHESRELGETIRSFKRIQKVRWVPATQESYHVVVQNYKTFMSHLDKISFGTSSNTDYTLESRTYSQSLFRIFSDRNFIVTLHFHLDIILELTMWAKWLERKESTVIDLEYWYTHVRQSLNKLKTTPGPNLREFLERCQCGMASCNDIRTFENAAENTVKWKGQDLANNGLSQVPKLSLTFSHIIDSFLESFNHRFPPEAISAFSVLLPSHLHLTTVENWRNFGTYLQQYHGFLPSIADQLQDMKNRIIQSSFHERMQNDPPEIYWSNVLASEEFQLNQDLQRALKIALVQPSSTAQVESGFSIVSGIKTLQRSRMHTNILQDTLKLKFNGPIVKYLPKYRLARDWINAGHPKADAPKRQNVDKRLKRSEYTASMRF